MTAESLRPRLARAWWMLRTAARRGRFGHLGRRAVIVRPLALVGTRTMSIGEATAIGPLARLETVQRPGRERGELLIGDRVSMEQMAHVVAGFRITIEDDVCLSLRVTIIDTEHPHGEPGDGNRVLKVSNEDRPIHIGRRAFLGAGVVVLPGVTIGENAVIGANSVVSTDIPANAVAAGTPAKVIRRLP